MRQFLVLGLLAGCSSEPAIPDTCNGAVELCGRRFDEVSYPTTHNAMSTEDEGFINPNQYYGIERQLADGVRGLMLDLHEDADGVVSLCHGTCLLGVRDAIDGLRAIRGFLEDHRGEVVTIIFESYVTADQVAEVFADSGLDRLVHAQAPGEPWPTLRELIEADERLIAFTDADGGGAYDWYMDVWAHAWETDYAAREVTDFSCDMNRGVAGNPLFIFNHFLTRTKPVPDEADTTNADPFLVDRAQECQAASGSLPNFVTVDFYSVGDLFEAVRILNGL
ncbi:MAG TPA: hypothetical protein VL172_05450 [Kofleriaceae bacterium]|nr:hypothetical protein [Kofleriaceae bacterium]